MCTEVTRLHVTRTPGGRARLVSSGGVFRAMQVGRHPAGVTVALVPERALLLAGDDVAIEVEVGAGLALEITEAAGTVAYDMRGGRARWAISYRVGAGASLVHQALPWVSAAGSDVARSTRVALDVGASAVLRETVVLGRHGEQPGALVSHTHVVREGHEVLVEEVHADDLTPRLGAGHRVLDQVLALGPLRTTGVADEPLLTRLDLASGDTVWRRLDADAHGAAAALDRVASTLCGGLSRAG